MTDYKTIAESNNFIVLDRYTKISELRETPMGYQAESDLERGFIHVKTPVERCHPFRF